MIQRLLHAALDYNYLKYDRHFEYHEYKQSPVGFHWQRLKRLVEIFHQFSVTQEKEVTIFNGDLPKSKGLIKTLLHYWNNLKSRIEENQQLVAPRHKIKLNTWLTAKEVPKIITAAREFVQVDAVPFTKQVQSLYSMELNRWTKH